ncbi:hypothetical protein Srubr_19500 [Streptomyces rubradiris]|uniref:Uncharacterized protein n=1 Tax=Streptomyces rubradiris TaxID=285531 RepID=A0ABQ3R8D1_STRRR|nr:hypothetical protein GCM10018792_59240 [Streptomyces rubradiris]GHI52104.1 hypothetical protein Srubr_19500 [Streptomyces rubradiris]
MHEAPARSVNAAARQVRDLARMAQALVALADMPSPPAPRLPFRSDALADIEKARSDHLDELRRFATLSASTDHTKAIRHARAPHHQPYRRHHRRQ